jgi:hypothetical protein
VEKNKVKKLSLWLFLFFIFLSGLLSLITPPEARIGAWVKVIYFHASIARGSVYLFILAALAALLAFRDIEWLRWSSAFETTAIIFWLAQSALGLYIMKAIWGGVLFKEPKAQVALYVLLFSFILVLVVEISKSNKFFQFSSIAMGVGVTYLVLSARNVFHPQNAIGASPSLFLKVLFEAVSISTFFALFFLSWWLKEHRKSWFSF